MSTERSAAGFVAGFRVPIQGSAGSCQPALSTEGSPIRCGLLSTPGISFRRLIQLSDAKTPVRSLKSLAALSALSLRLLSTFSALARAAVKGLSGGAGAARGLSGGAGAGRGLSGGAEGLSNCSSSSTTRPTRTVIASAADLCHEAKKTGDQNNWGVGAARQRMRPGLGPAT